MLYFIEAHLFSMLFTFLTLVLVLRVLGRQRQPGTTLAWILAIVAVPYVGIPAYILLGGRKLRHIQDTKQALHPATTQRPYRLLEFDNPAEDVLTSVGMAPPTRGNRVETIANGEEAYRRLCEDIDAAESAIFIEIFIWDTDDVARDLVQRLARRAEAGVDVRILLDSYGCILTPTRMFKPLIKAGGRVERFLPMLPVRRNWSLNLRNHRKMIIIDYRRAAVGGMNIGEEYLGPEPTPDRWIDSMAVIEGPAVHDILEIFCSDWNFAAREALDTPEIADHAVEAGTRGHENVQVAAAGPDVVGDPLYEAILALAHTAEERIWMVTPYFAPGDELFRALTMQARAGKDVRLIMPAKSNHPAADLARGPYLRRLVDAGGTVLLYPHRMIHAKHMVFDDHTALTGTMNLDMRSLYLNFEVGVFTYDGAQVDIVTQWMNELAADAQPIGPATPGAVRQLGEQLSFLLSPLL